jgi:hypothetical protein
VPVFAKGQKNDRIITMSSLFKIGKVRVHASQNDFIEQWINFDGGKKNQRDDLLDAVEIAIGVAGVLLPSMPHAANFEHRDESPEHEARAQLQAARGKREPLHDTLGENA